MLGWMVAGLLLSQTVCFDGWNSVLPLGHCLAASWLGNSCIDIEALDAPQVPWANQHWQKPGQALYLALDTTMLWSRFGTVALSVVVHSRAISLLWMTLEPPSAASASRT
jgi:hypothetical protein